jgi:hypothetical protein
VRYLTLVAAAIGTALVSGAAAQAPVPAQPPSWTVPPESQRCPSKWGARDERGSINHMKPQAVLNAAKLIKTGEVIELSQVQVGTQFDGFAHQSFENSHYNCLKTEEIATRGNFTKLGIHTVGAVITRGVLIDVAGLKGVETLPDAYEITVQDLEDALKKQNTTIQAG